MDYVVSVTYPHSLSFLLLPRKEPHLAISGHPVGALPGPELSVDDVPRPVLVQGLKDLRGNKQARAMVTSHLLVTTVTLGVLSLMICSVSLTIILATSWGSEFHIK